MVSKGCRRRPEHIFTMYNSSHSGDIVVVRYEAGAGGYRIVPITEEEFAIMMGGPHPKTAKTNKVFPTSNQPQPIFTKSKEENRPPVPGVYRGGRIKESLNPESGILAKKMETSKHSRPLLAASSKAEEGSIIKKNSSIGNASPPPILPAFLRPKVRTNRNSRLYNSCGEYCEDQDCPAYGIYGRR